MLYPQCLPQEDKGQNRSPHPSLPQAFQKQGRRLCMLALWAGRENTWPSTSCIPASHCTDTLVLSRCSPRLGSAKSAWLSWLGSAKSASAPRAWLSMLIQSTQSPLDLSAVEKISPPLTYSPVHPVSSCTGSGSGTGIAIAHATDIPYII